MKSHLRHLLAAFSAAVFFVNAAEAAEYKVGLTATFSGDFAAFGQSLREGADLAVKQKGSGDVVIKFDTVDDHGSAQDGVLIAQRFCSDDDVKAVLGYTFSSVALAAVPIFDQCQLPVLASAVTGPDLSNSSSYFRRDVMTDAIQGAALGKYAATKLGLKNVYVIHSQDDYGIGVANAFSESVKSAGGAVVNSQAYNLGTTDFRTILAQVKAANPDAVFIGGFYSEASKITQQAKQMGLTTQFLGTDGSLNTQLLSLAKGSAEGMIVYGMFDASIVNDDSAAFIKGYREAYGKDPDVWAALGYDAVGVLVSQLQELQKHGEVTRAKVNEALTTVSGYPGVTGQVSFTPSGDRDGKLFFLQIKDNKFVLLPN